MSEHSRGDAAAQGGGPGPGLGPGASRAAGLHPERTPPGVWRLFGPALGAWGIAAVAITQPPSGAVILWLGIGAGCGIVAVLVVRGILQTAARRADRRAASMVTPVLLGCAIVILLGVRIDSGFSSRAASDLTLAAERGGSIEVALTVSGYPGTDRRGDPWVAAHWTGDTGRVAVVVWCGDSEGPERPGAERPGAHTCGAASWGPGTKIRVIGSITELSPGNSAAFGVRVERVLGAAPGSAAAAAASALRAGLREQASAVPGAALLPGLAVGDTALVSETTEERMRDASLTHLVAVSGANCALVTGAIGWALGWCGAGRRVRVLGQGLALAAFVFVVGPDPSVQRAAVMAVVVLISGFGGRRAVALPALGVAIIVLLLRDPWQALHPAFALSVCATAGILLGVPALHQVLAVRARVPGWLALPVAVATAAQLACGPLLLLLQPGIPAVGVLANVLAAPAAPLGTGSGLLALLALPVVPTLGKLFVWVGALAGKWLEATAAVAVALPFARIPWPGGWPGAILLAAAEVALIAAWWLGSGRADRTGGRAPWLGRYRVGRAATRWASVLAGAGVAAFVVPTLVVPATLRSSVPADWAIAVCDVGQGDAMFLRNPEVPEVVALYDTGEFPDALRDCAERFGVRRITVLFISHDHIDHYGAVEAVTARVERAIVAPEHAEDQGPRPLLRTLADADIHTVTATAGDEGVAVSPSGVLGITWKVLGPPRDRTPAHANASSLVVSMRVGELTVLLLGDIGETEQRALVRDGHPLAADVQKVAHHGSRDQFAEFHAHVGAELGIISSGLGNRHGHPARETMADLRAAQTRVLRTDQLGHIAVSGAPGGLRVWSSAAHAVAGDPGPGADPVSLLRKPVGELLVPHIFHRDFGHS